MKRILLLNILIASLSIPIIFLQMGCSKDDESTEEPEPQLYDLVGTWDVLGLGSFSIDQDNSAAQEMFLNSVYIELENAICIMTDFNHNFDHFAFPNVHDHKISNAMAGDASVVQAGVVVRGVGFTRDDLKRMEFSCDFASFPNAMGTMTLFLRNSFSSDWCEESFNFTAKKMK